jgi:hypothetical protein
MSRERQKGTGFEVELLYDLKRVWPDVARAGTTLGANDKGDFINVEGWVVEAKKHDRWRIMEWIRTAMKKAPGGGWIIVSAADRRKLPMTVATLPFRMLMSLFRQINRLKFQQRFSDNQIMWLRDHVSTQDLDRFERFCSDWLIGEQ